MTRRDLSLLVAGMGALLTVGWFYGFLVTDVYEGYFSSNVDYTFTNFVQSNRSVERTDLMRAATDLGGGAVVAGATLAFASITYLVTRSTRWPVFVLLAGVGGTIIDNVLKPLVGRARPQLGPLVDIESFSFPSGHATAITGLWLAIALFAHLRWGRKAVLVWPLALGVIGLVALSRVYLGVHWPMDVIAGTLLSGIWVFLCLHFTGLTRRTATE